MRPLAVFAHGVLRFLLDGVIWHNVESALPERGVLLRAGIKRWCVFGARGTSKCKHRRSGFDTFVVCQQEIGEWARFGQMNVGDEVFRGPVFCGPGSVAL